MPLNRSQKRKQDPTGQASRRRKATRALDSRLNNAERKIKPLIRALPAERRVVTPIQNAEQSIFYDYELSPAELMQLENAIRSIINGELETTTENVPAMWFWSEQIEPPYRQGTVEELNRFNQLISAAIIAGLISDPFVQPVQVDDFIFDNDSYRVPLNNQIASNFSTIKSLSDRTAAQVIQVVNSGLQSGLSRQEIINQISERFDVSNSNAKRIADTEINKAYNDGKLNTTKQIQNKTGVRTAVLHISALLPTTRDSHASRHGKAYTVEDQLSWWNAGVNRINCKCSTNAVLIDSRGNIIQTQDEETLIAERKFFEQEQFE